MTVTERVLPARRGATPFPSEGAGVAPFQFPLDGNEYLRASMLSDTANASVRVQGRLLRPSGEIANFAFTLRSADALLMVEEEYQLGQGALLSVFALPTAASQFTPWGDIYVTLTIVRGRGDNAVELGVLVQSYVAFKQPAAWPGSPIRSSLDGPPRPYALALGGSIGTTTYSFTGATGYRLRVAAIMFILSADATPGDRSVTVALFNQGVQVGNYGAPVLQGPGTGILYNAVPGIANGATAVAGRVNIALPPTVYLNETDMVTVGWNPPVGAVDTLNNVSLLAERWLVLPGMGLL